MMLAVFSHLINGFGSRHTRQTHVMFGFPPQNIKFLPVDFHFKRVVLDLGGGLSFADLVSKAPLLRRLPHLEESSSSKPISDITDSIHPAASI